MNDQHDQPPQKADLDQEASTEPGNVRATMELTRQALEASAAELERSRRLLRETEELVQLPVPSQPDKSSEEDESS